MSSYANCLRPASHTLQNPTLESCKFYETVGETAITYREGRGLHDPTYSINPELSYAALSTFHLMSKRFLLLDIWGFSVSLISRGEILCKHFVPFLNLMLPRISFRRRWFGTLSISYFRLLPIGCNVQFAADNCIMVQLSLLVAMVLYAERWHLGSNFTFDSYHTQN